MEVTNKKKRVTIQVYGIVQGVFFRANTCDFAQKLGLRGTVRNVRDGSVEIVAEGEEEDLNKLITFAKAGPPSAKVYNIDVNWEDSKDDLPYFSITY
ncbi:MAG: acylphosphatase [Candidatus Heimdallarchaeota archaeon]|nr:acylphosphatase [Candidatus Heimdallarchaeota archaeon]MCK4877732.1 acylphosphatase [Candidatus Heimdallarchaeota archaeon]